MARHLSDHSAEVSKASTPRGATPAPRLFPLGFALGASATGGLAGNARLRTIYLRQMNLPFPPCASLAARQPRRVGQRRPGEAQQGRNPWGAARTRQGHRLQDVVVAEAVAVRAFLKAVAEAAATSGWRFCNGCSGDGNGAGALESGGSGSGGRCSSTWRWQRRAPHATRAEV